MLSVLKALFLFLGGGVLLAFPSVASRAAVDALRLCADQLIPALFPFFVFSALLQGQPGAAWLALPLRPAARIAGLRSPQAALIVLLSWCGGYAVCARLVRQGIESGELSRPEGELLLVLGACASPGFAVGAIGGLLGDPALGLRLYLACLAGNLVCAAACRPLVRIAPGKAEHENTPAPCSLAGAIGQGVQSCLSVCGCVVLFRVLAALAGRLLALEGVAAALCTAVLEVSSGCALLSETDGMLPLYGCCAALSILSGSVFMQLRSLLGGCCSVWCLALTRPLHLTVSLGVLALSLRLLPQSAAAYSSLAPRLVVTSRSAPDAALLIFCLCCMTLRLVHTVPRANAAHSRRPAHSLGQSGNANSSPSGAMYPREKERSV